MRSGGSSATSSPMAPPPPPPPPPPQLDLDEEVRLMTKEAKALAPKRMDFRDILTLFHDSSSAIDANTRARAWENLYSATLAEAQEEHRLQRKLGNKSAQDDTSRSGKPGGPEPPKRPRQLSAADTEPSKLSRVSRVPNRPKPGGSKLMQKLGARGT